MHSVTSGLIPLSGFFKVDLGIDLPVIRRDPDKVPALRRRKVDETHAHSSRWYNHGRTGWCVHGR
jgi:hypothetical protein